jgi:hypothetical protein
MWWLVELLRYDNCSALDYVADWLEKVVGRLQFSARFGFAFVINPFARCYPSKVKAFVPETFSGESQNPTNYKCEVFIAKAKYSWYGGR